jgi:hypothetical protein
MRDNHAEAEMLTINVRNFFRRAFGMTPGEIRSFKSNTRGSAYLTVYLQGPSGGQCVATLKRISAAGT